jgi:hypothetical protein
MSWQENHFVYATRAKDFSATQQCVFLISCENDVLQAQTVALLRLFQSRATEFISFMIWLTSLLQSDTDKLDNENSAAFKGWS